MTHYSFRRESREPSKQALRDMITQAVVNTGGTLAEKPAPSQSASFPSEAVPALTDVVESVEEIAEEIEPYEDSAPLPLPKPVQKYFTHNSGIDAAKREIARVWRELHDSDAQHADLVADMLDGLDRIRHRTGRPRKIVAVLAAVALVLLAVGDARARDPDGKYAQANPELHRWVEGLRSGRGPCCSDADGTAVSDVDWDVKDGHYRVRIEGEWWDVPENALITEPNRIGRTMVWPIYYRSLDAPVRIEIRCFLPGPGA